MTDSTIRIDVQLDHDKIPSQIFWQAAGSTADEPQKAKAMLLAFWDGADKTAMRVDLWTKEMMVDEMADFYYQTLMTMADTYQRATRNEVLVNDMKQFARDFYNKFKDQQMKENAVK
ncbi:gliding motility protein GldC [Flavihumibacter petaseus]|uniref:Gliding motility protein GldC n=1 Tax=Flavihumibacter petaseus NBRC 106054 TaxID=1220578 RepID=A0A0E9MZ65_9BACT|nr:gliding motility protein GldC [Flavihumibacter petaseus]GAO42838.1 hypothetical protein FPE01S_01_18560 [Flavihumibacter petaseus NBRC 106054]